MMMACEGNNSFKSFYSFPLLNFFLFQESKDWFDRMKMESSAAAASANSPRLVSQEETQRFFDETRERLFQTSRLNVLTPTNTLVNNMAGNNINDNDNVDPIGQFVREHHERFAALTASIMGDNNTSTATSATAGVVDVNGKSVLRPQRDHVVHSAHAAAGLNQSLVRPHPTLTRSDTQPLDGATCQQTSAADLVASILQRLVHRDNFFYLIECILLNCFTYTLFL